MDKNASFTVFKAYSQSLKRYVPLNKKRKLYRICMFLCWKRSQVRTIRKRSQVASVVQLSSFLKQEEAFSDVYQTYYTHLHIQRTLYKKH